MIYLKRHFSFLFGIREKCFCWAHDANTIFAFNISYEKKLTDRFFYTIIEKGNVEVKRIPVIEYFLVFGTSINYLFAVELIFHFFLGNGFAPGELDKEFYYIRRDRRLKQCRNFKAPEFPLSKLNINCTYLLY